MMSQQQSFVQIVKTPCHNILEKSTLVTIEMNERLIQSLEGQQGSIHGSFSSSA